MWLKIKKHSHRMLLLIPLFVICRVEQAQEAAPMHLTLPQAMDLALRQNRSLGLARLGVIDSEHKKEVAPT